MTDKTTPLDRQLDAENLDPENWDEMRALGHRMIDDVVDYLSSVRERPVWQPPSESMRAFLSQEVPSEPMEPSTVYDQFVEHIRPYPLGNIHPRFWAWYMGNGTVMGAYAELLAATMNSNAGAGKHGPMVVEEQVIDWMRELLGLPQESSGLLVSGGSMANLVGLVVARHAKSSFDHRQYGYQFGPGATAKPMRIYGSAELHSCNQKALELMGMGHEGLVRIPVDTNYCVDMALLRKAIEDDMAAGFQPICVIGTSGTVNTGAIDDLQGIADLCDEFGLWFHIDGAIGAIAVLADDLRGRLAGLERADSIALDLHKWLHVPFEAGCIMVRHGDQHKDAFSLIPEYLAKEASGVASGINWASEYGVQLSRQFRALKIWMTFKEHGTVKLGRMMSKNVEQAHYLAARIEATEGLELVAPVGLDIVCYRAIVPGFSVDALNALNKRILTDMQESGTAVPSYTTLNGVYCIRVAISNHRSEQADFDLLVDETVRLAAKLAIEAV
ncbi:MAG: aspartate aminotransferase family protein [Gammaproteobacteria bacterium]